ncbi:hypothetical protein ONZ45_g15608 [Pleurotus djamor]|nr:hypothetical protein ONZ45_g15608 [Pleurotus djamor]
MRKYDRRQGCILTLTQKDWVSKLPAIEFAINISRSESTGYAPFFLNSGRIPRPFIWDSNQAVEFPGIRAFAQRIQRAIMSAHDSILAARVKQTRDANRHRRPSPFAVNDLVYISTKNISFPKGLARKFVPKYIGPYKIVRDYQNETYQIELSARLKQRGVHDAFHASLLRIHIPNDDRLFPGRLDSQIFEEDDYKEPEWAVDSILSHYGSKAQALFEIRWTSGDVTWLPYHQVSHLQALAAYLEALGVPDIGHLPPGTGSPPNEDPQIFSGSVTFQLEPSPFPSPINTTTHSPIYSSAPRRPRRSPKRPRRSQGPPPAPRSHHLLRRRKPLRPCLPCPCITSAKPRNRKPRRNPRNRTMSQAFTMFVCTGPNSYTITNPDDGKAHTYTVEQIKDYIRFDRGLRKGIIKPTDPAPAGYLEFANLFNLEEHVFTKFTIFGDNGRPIIDGPQLGLQAVLPDGDYTPTVRVMSTPISKMKTSPVPPATTTSSSSLSTLTPRRRELIDDLVWDHLENTVRAKKRREGFIAARQAQKAQKVMDRAKKHQARIRSFKRPGTPFPSTSNRMDITLDDFDEADYVEDTEPHRPTDDN